MGADTGSSLFCFFVAYSSVDAYHSFKINESNFLSDNEDEEPELMSPRSNFAFSLV